MIQFAPLPHMANWLPKPSPPVILKGKIDSGEVFHLCMSHAGPFIPTDA